LPHVLLVQRLVKQTDAMENYLKKLAARLMRISYASLDMGTARKLRELSRELEEKADEFGADTFNRKDEHNGNHRSH
jgi:hypothetical protein